MFTTIAPAFFTYSFILYKESGRLDSASILAGISILLSLLCVLIVRLAGKRFYQTAIKAEVVRPSDKEISGYFVAYLVPLIGGGEYFSDWRVFLFFSVMFYVFVFFSKSFYANPILSLFGYKFHELQLSTGMSALLLTKRKLQNAADIDEVVYLTEHTLLDTKR